MRLKIKNYFYAMFSSFGKSKFKFYDFFLNYSEKNREKHKKEICSRRSKHDCKDFPEAIAKYKADLIKYGTDNKKT
jgi:hypothetical protein